VVASCGLLLCVATPPPAAAWTCEPDEPPGALRIPGPAAAPKPDSTPSPPAGDERPPGSRRTELAQAGTADHASPLTRFVKDVASDYRHSFSIETALWYSSGAAAAGLVHLADEDVREALADPPQATQTALEGGDRYGNPDVQGALAFGWWLAGRLTHNDRGTMAGRDLVRAQINAVSWTYALKYAFDRERPNGDPRSFPSGHAAATFATAMVLQEHYGWTVGLPFFVAAGYTAVSRLTIEKHWASDVTFGAFLGMASGRTVTWHLRQSRFQVVPVARNGGAAVLLVRAP
jgi:hypothetical protein